MADDVEGDWGVIDGDESVPVTNGQPAKRMRKPFNLNNLFINTKSKFYNMCKPMSKTLPEFSGSPVVMLGVTYRPPRISGSKNKSASRRQAQQQRAQPKPPLYTFFNKLSVIPWVEDSKLEASPPASTDLLPSFILAFLRDFRSRLWLTYRSNFPTIEGTTLVTDMGWGCMLRTGQMLLAQAFITHYLGREWRIQDRDNMMTYRELLRWFADEESIRSPYSIHAIARVGLAKFGKQIGDWFEPTTISEALRLLVMQHSPDGIKMYVPRDGIIYRKEVYHLCANQPVDGPSQAAFHDSEAGLESSTDSMRYSHSGNSGQLPLPISGGHTDLMSSAESEDSSEDAPPVENSWSPVIILVPVRLGIQCLNPVYIPALKAFLALPQSLGIIGGKPHSSFYFVGHQDNKVLYMDPHFVQPAVRMEDDPLFPIESFQMEIPQSMAFEDIDPSLAVGFLCSSQVDFDDFCAAAATLGREGPCIFSIAEHNTVYRGSSTTTPTSSSSPSPSSTTSSSSSTSSVPSFSSSSPQVYSRAPSAESPGEPGPRSVLVDGDDEEYVLV